MNEYDVIATYSVSSDDGQNTVFNISQNGNDPTDLVFDMTIKDIDGTEEIYACNLDPGTLHELAGMFNTASQAVQHV